jgi:hypothetical protein
MTKHHKHFMFLSISDQKPIPCSVFTVRVWQNATEGCQGCRYFGELAAELSRAAPTD